MKFSFSKNADKILEIPPTHAEDNITQYRHLHKKTLEDLDKTGEYSDFMFIKENEIPTHIVLGYKEPLKPNVIIKLSQPLIDKMIKGEKEDYFLDCEFFYKENDNGDIILRFAKPYLEFDKITSLIK